MTLSRAWELFHNAKRCFEMESGDERDRLISAAQELFHLLQCDMPEDFAHEIRNLIAVLTNVEGVGGEGSIAATVAQLSDENVEGFTARILDLEKWLSSVK